jgi:diacylglycerol kinase (ATP)
VKRLLRACINSWNGLRAVARSEEAFQQELAVFLLSLPLAYLVGTDTWTRVALVLVIVLVMIVELINTAIEKLSDHVSPAIDPRIGYIKDLGSAAVGVSLLLAGFVWLIALAQRLGVF